MQSSTRRVSGGILGPQHEQGSSSLRPDRSYLGDAGGAPEQRCKASSASSTRPLGYDPHNVMSVGIPVHDGSYPTWEARSAYFEQIRNRVAAVPGVTFAAISTNATPPSNGWNTGIEILGKPPQDSQKVRVNFVSPGYFPILHIPLAQGRLWDERENLTTRHGLSSSTKPWRVSISPKVMRSATL